MQGITYGLSFSTTPSHGYLEVPKFLVDRVGFVPSNFSVLMGNRWFLEEDDDAGFCLDLFEKAGIKVFIQSYVKGADFEEMLERFSTFSN